jgi:hypothetical protein
VSAAITTNPGSLMAWSAMHAVGPQNVGTSAPEGDSSFCGSAYDVVLLKGEGYTGGEIAENQT